MSWANGPVGPGCFTGPTKEDVEKIAHRVEVDKKTIHSKFKDIAELIQKVQLEIKVQMNKDRRTLYSFIKRLLSRCYPTQRK